MVRLSTFGCIFKQQILLAYSPHKKRIHQIRLIKNILSEGNLYNWKIDSDKIKNAILTLGH